ncbi:5-formaminoimidazole-4-carboxamide-1-(beta)-D-ribofuranosyl 5'-monophosphate synthetase [bacterium]|nr:5-formaminoimidazole-4-carboxamide-1-(beta)-D-ribofuranosyl 5'-monophosphate synthetase [bacterium]
MPSIKDYKIATLGSHSALQILKGAKDEGFETICICMKGKTKPYESYKVADRIIEIDKFDEFFTLQDELIKEKAIIIPHGSFVSYIGPKRMNDVKVMHYGTKGILEFESDREKEREWLLDAGCRMPRIFDKPEDIDVPVIVKFHGANGGKGYFVANSPEDFYEGIKHYPGNEKYVLQEYIVGVPMYTHYFYSPLTEELEIMSFDKRYESNADSIGRISAQDQLDAKIKTSYTITGNMPLVIRESMLPDVFEMGENVVKASRKLVGKGLYGPFCLEAIVDPNLNFYVFEISARIVAGTNPFVHGSPYTWLRYDEPMSTGRRIARDIKMAIEQDRLAEVLG